MVEYSGAMTAESTVVRKAANLAVPTAARKVGLTAEQMVAWKVDGSADQMAWRTAEQKAALTERGTVV
jgi:hypothetical protein